MSFTNLSNCTINIRNNTENKGNSNARKHIEIVDSDAETKENNVKKRKVSDYFRPISTTNNDR